MSISDLSRGGTAVANPLYYASTMGLVNVVEELLARGWDPDGSNEQPPLHKAII
jgi:hypothetical protein